MEELNVRVNPETILAEELSEMAAYIEAAPAEDAQTDLEPFDDHSFY